MNARTFKSLRNAAADTVVTVADRLRVKALELRGAKSRCVDTCRGPLHVIEVDGEGSLPPVVLMHGLSASAHDFGPLMSRIRSWSRRIIAPDLPGHGLNGSLRDATSPRTLLRPMCEVLEACLQGEPAVVMGTSLGGAVSIRVALARPHLVDGLFLVSPAGARADMTQWRKLLQDLHIDSNAEARAFMRRVLPHSRVAPLLAWGARVRFSRAGVRGLVESAVGSDLLSPTELACLDVPLELVWGREDHLLPPEHLEWFREHLPASARVVTPPHFGHAPFLSYPEEVAQMLHDFVRAVSHREERFGRGTPVQATA